jgi:Immune inhibitor A peptidase M6
VSGTTGTWSAVSGGSDGYEQWTIDLSQFAGRQIEISLSYASDDRFHFGGVEIDDVVLSTGAGSTSFADDGPPRRLDGPRAAAGERAERKRLDRRPRPPTRRPPSASSWTRHSPASRTPSAS